MHRRRFCNQWTLQKNPTKLQAPQQHQEQTSFSLLPPKSLNLLHLPSKTSFVKDPSFSALFPAAKMMTSGATSTARDHRSLFTPTQWQELEHQALIFKYMVSGVPIPPDLIISVRRSLESSLASRIFPPQPIGWGCFQVGFGRKADPEPGRCRRTDGKKWRCSKEAYPDSKYCERHMHRGRNRSRKPVEASSSAASTPTTTNPSPSVSSLNRNVSMNPPASPLPSSISPEIYSHHDLIAQKPTHHLNPFLYSQTSSSRTHASPGLSPHDGSTTHHFFLDSGSCSQPDKDFRYFHGLRETVDERAFFPEASGSIRSLHDSCQPLTMDASYKAYSHHHSQFQSFSHDNSKQQEDGQHCFVLGTDFKSARPLKFEKEDEIQKPLHHFFGEWPPKNTDSWLDLSSNSRVHTDS